MVYVDTNVLIYAAIEQDFAKKERSIALLEECITKNRLLISLLVLQEYVFTLTKLKVDAAVIEKDVRFYSDFAQPVSKQIFLDSYALCAKIDFCRNINDAIHLVFAARHCDKLITFDADFQKLQPHMPLEIEILE